MSWWKFWESDDADGSPDYYAEGVTLTHKERYHEALTSFRLALRERPDDAAAMEQMAVVYTRIGMTDEAVKMYRRALDEAPESPSAHYGLGFLLLKRGREEEAVRHLRIFLAAPADERGSQEHVEHARRTLEDLDREIQGEDARSGAESGPSGTKEPEPDG